MQGFFFCLLLNSIVACSLAKLLNKELKKKTGGRRPGLKGSKRNISLNIIKAWKIGYVAMKPREKEGPFGLSGIQVLGQLNILKIFVIHVDGNLILGSLLFQGPFYSQKLSVANIVNSLREIELVRIERTGMHV